MAYDNLTDASSVGKLIPEAVAAEILKNTPQQSAAMRFLRRIPLSTRTMRQNVLSALPVAYFVNGDTGLKQTTELEWKDKVMTVEEIATILPVPINVLDDLSFDFWSEARPLIEEAIGRLIDGAVFFGYNKPSSWPAAIAPAAIAAGNVTDLASGDMPGQTGWGPKYVDKISDLMSEVESDGYDVNGFVIPRSFRGVLRKLRDADGNKLADLNGGTYEGVAFQPAMDGQWPATGDQDVTMIAGDFTKGILGIRKDITYETFREGVIQDATGKIIFNLMQQDMMAMRVTMRLGFQTVNPINYSNLTEAERYPFAVLRTPNV
jgi:HK97 family phage major capsid protein